MIRFLSFDEFIGGCAIGVHVGVGNDSIGFVSEVGLS